MISIIVCTDTKGAIGKNGKLAHNSKADMQMFKKITQDHIVIMGRKTWDSLYKKPLPKRYNIVVSRGANIEEADMTTSDLPKVLEYYKNKPYEVFVIGGGEIYRQSMSYTDKIYLSVVDSKVEEPDTFFPLDMLDANVWSKDSMIVTPEVIVHVFKRTK